MIPLRAEQSLLTDTKTEAEKVEAAPAGQDKGEVGEDESSAQQNPGRTEMTEKYTLRSHMDIVRGIKFFPSSLETMATISEDCMVKLWNLGELEKKYSETDGNPEPYLTLRGHTGPLLAVTGLDDNRQQNSNANVLFTAGIEGSIRVWNTPPVSEVN